MEKTSSKTLPSKPGFGGRLPFRKIAPNIVTMLALCAGVTSIRYSVQEDWVKQLSASFSQLCLTAWTAVLPGC